MQHSPCAQAAAAAATAPARLGDRLQVGLHAGGLAAHVLDVVRLVKHQQRAVHVWGRRGWMGEVDDAAGGR